MFLLFLACTGGKPADTQDTEGMGDNAGESDDTAVDTAGDTGDTSGDTGGDTTSEETDTGETQDTGETGAEASPPCGEHYQVGEIGAVKTWTYYLGGGSTSTNTGWDPKTGIATSESDQERHAADYIEYSHVWWEHRCDVDGLWAIRSYEEWTRDYPDGTTSTGWTETVFDGALMGTPELKVGVAWTSSGTQTQTESVDGVVGDPVTEELGSDMTVIAYTTITVAAGTYDVYQVEGLVRGSLLTYYVSTTVGAVKNQSGELLAYEPAP